MATLDQVLRYSMFSQAGSSAKLADLGVVPFPKPVIPKGKIDDDDAVKRAVWHFDHDAGATPNRITNLTCISRGMGKGRMVVATEVAVERAGIVTVQGTAIDLPLTPQFLLRKGYLKSGKLVSGLSFLYPLPAEIDLSMSVTFGYDFNGGANAAPVVIPEDALDSVDFMPAAGNEPAKVTIGKGQKARVVAAPLRVIVCISFVTAKERADFEPGGLLGAGRVWPHVLIMANRDIAESSCSIHVKRPASHTMKDIGKDFDHSIHADMNLGIESSLYADNNVLIQLGPGAPSPYWDDLFAWYEVAVSASTGAVRAVDPLEKGGSIPGAVSVLDSTQLAYTARNTPRVARQGAFDNIHVAPTMTSPRASVHPGVGLERIYMAPFCEHDCLHTHWRWATSNTVKPVFGWSQVSSDPRVPGQPYQVAGAPMVPANQSVTLTMTSPSSFRYDAKAVGKDGVNQSPAIASGTFSIFFHHGMAYAISLSSAKIQALDTLIDANAIARNEPGVGATAMLHTPIRYWRLRFGGDDIFLTDTDKVNERQKVVSRAKLLARTSP